MKKRGKKMENTKNVQAVISFSLAAVTAYFNVLLIPLIILLIAMIIDYATGMTVAWQEHQLNSRIGIKGIIKKISYGGLVAVAMGVDWLIWYTANQMPTIEFGVQSSFYFGALVCVWLIINEMISILENLKKLGVPMPVFLEKIVNRLKITVDGKDEKND